MHLKNLSENEGEGTRGESILGRAIYIQWDVGADVSQLEKADY